MKCHLAEEFISKFCESRLGSGESKRLFRHLDRCGRCQDLVWGIERRLRFGGFDTDPEELSKDISRMTSLILENFY